MMRSLRTGGKTLIDETRTDMMLPTAHNRGERILNVMLLNQENIFKYLPPHELKKWFLQIKHMQMTQH